MKKKYEINHRLVTSLLGPAICAELIAQAYADIPVYFDVNGVREQSVDVFGPLDCGCSRISRPVSPVNSGTCTVDRSHR